MDMSLSNSWSWWWPVMPGVLQSMGSQRVGPDWTTFTFSFFYNVVLVSALQQCESAITIFIIFKADLLTYLHSVELSCVQIFVTPWTAACQASLSITNSWSLLKLMSIQLVMPSNHLILCRPLLLLCSIFPSIRVFSNESVLHIGWPKELGGPQSTGSRRVGQNLSNLAVQHTC